LKKGEPVVLVLKSTDTAHGLKFKELNVEIKVSKGGTGEIQFKQNGSRHFAPARSDAGVAIARGKEVVVMRYDQGIAYVRPWDELSGESMEISGDSSSAKTATATTKSDRPDGKDRAL
jgi:hypothetical protein